MIPFAMNQVHQGDVLELLAQMPDESVQCVVSSPPYWGLRCYGLPPTVWDADPACQHDWGPEGPAPNKRGGSSVGTTLEGASAAVQEAQNQVRNSTSGSVCRLCGAWRGCLGLEPTPELYVQHLVIVFEEVRRVLRSDGVLWLNLGDCYATGASKVGDHPGGGAEGERWARPRCVGRAVRDGRHPGKETAMTAMGPMIQPNRLPIPGLKPKDLVGAPWRVAFALQAKGWWLRSDVIWEKPNVKPESARDRPTRSHEYLFLLTKNSHYFFDQFAIRVGDSGAPSGNGFSGRQGTAGYLPMSGGPGSANRWRPGGGRNRRTVWTISAQGYDGQHYAAFPEALIDPCLLAGTSEKGSCTNCGAPRQRIVERAAPPTAEMNGKVPPCTRDGGLTAQDGMERTGLSHFKYNEWLDENPKQTVGWEATCECGKEDLVPCLVLDPFAGSGTTGVVALKHGRRFLGFDLSEEYVRMANERLQAVKTGVSVKEIRTGQLPLFTEGE